MFKRITGVLAVIAAIATVVMVVVNRGNYSSMIFEDANKIETQSAVVVPKVDDVKLEVDVLVPDSLVISEVPPKVTVEIQ